MKQTISGEIEMISSLFSFKDGENTRSVNVGNKFRGHMERTHLVVLVDIFKEGRMRGSS